MAEQIEGSCPPAVDAGLTPDGVDLIGQGENVSGGGAGGESDGGGVAEPPQPPQPPDLGSDETPNNDNGLPPGCTGAPDICDPELIVTWSDIASFRAAAPQLTMEPDGWAVRGLPTNFVATASVEVIAGSLLGFPAEVRFTPVGFAWDYGDGATGYSASGGSSWGAAAFSETATSHIYTTRGDFSARVAVELSAEYRFGGGGWRPISGTIRLAASATPVSVKSATTVLVAGSCVARPSDPGC
ncbi:hypothetical protein [Microterricola pindariensis]|uniref:PKD domain-containing protein n=1 Tax=Microterricola pindariensis TaxID=478010 RepID=A0ABX5AR12_9MICO|nr:hypothetical protein [Microterricola pindariensis]PPL14512.1 hypothetical protein GY24_16090 [Microterricola pindariensis]